LNVDAQVRACRAAATKVREVFRERFYARAHAARIALFIARLGLLLQPFMVFKSRGFT
jgi:hypothetical protein